MSIDCKLLTPLSSEPITKQRFKILTKGLVIPEYLFFNFKIYNKNNVIFLETEFYECTDFIVNPLDIFNITEFTVQYLDPIGSVVNEMVFSVESINFEKSGTYYEDGLLTTKLIVKTSMEYIKKYESTNIIS